MDLNEIYAIRMHENHPIRRRFIGALIEQGKTDEEIVSLLPKILDDIIASKKSSATDDEIRSMIAPSPVK